MSTSSHREYKTYLLTGSTGVVGGRLLLELLATTEAKVYCLARDEDLDDANERILDMLRTYDPQQTHANEYHRAVPVYGTIDEDYLGMDQEQYSSLLSEVEAVFHCAAKLSLITGYDPLVETNVRGTARIAQFCLQANIPMLFTSSFSVVGDKLFEEGFVLKEDEYNYQQGFDGLGYERTKFESERLLNQLHNDKGLQVIIVRPGNIWGDSKTGCYPLEGTTVTGIYYEIVRTLVELGYATYSREDFDVTPVDYIAQACAHLLGNSEKFAGQTYNLVNPKVVTFNDIVSFIRDAGYQIRVIPDEDYYTALAEGRMMRNGKAYESTFTDILLFSLDEGDDADECAMYETSRARAALEPAGISCPVANNELFVKYLRYAASVGLIPPPEKQIVAKIQPSEDIAVHMEDLYEKEF